ncbi:glucan 1,4-alpha-glucosidase [Dyella jejuensis]|uniref:Glucan 1,4-alpha-glucosidase n=1 Tax=Dyella jejuensis TaxID=1432009 RepID=A0ABW8JLX5_9GAMM
MNAPGWPGLSPTWASSAKDIVGTALGAGRVWYTIGYGILNEVFWPSCSLPQIRDLGFIVAGDGFWSEVKRENCYEISTLEPDIPLVRITHRHARYMLELECLADPSRDVVLIRYRLHGEDLKLYTLLAPHLEGSGYGNNAQVLPHGLAAMKGSSALMLAASHGFARGSAGYVGVSDGWQDFHQHGAMYWDYSVAPNGNVALMGELASGEGELALAFANTAEGAQTLALSSLASGWEIIRERFIDGWQRWTGELDPPGATDAQRDAVRRAAMVLKAHVDRAFPGALVASLSVPWGDTRDDPGGYHLVWSRDAVEAGLALLASGHAQAARNMLAYLIATQHPDGHWAQNFYCDGRPYWTGVQLDEAALPVLLAAKLADSGCLDGLQPQATSMVRRALQFVARTGPFSPQDRWEENAGINPFSVGVSIAALVAGVTGGFLEGSDCDYALSLADDWNARIEAWVYVRGTALDHQHGVHGHYVRIAPPGQTAQRSHVALRNRGTEELPARDLLGLEYLYLVRLGLRQANDPRMADTTKLIDALLRFDTPQGPYYRRYNEDGYGEHEDGRAFDGTGVGRAWPLLSGERGHYAVLAGEDPQPYLDAMLASASQGGMIPEQVWDSEPIEARHLFPGRPTGSAMPLVWAHAELIKLVATITSGEPVERLPAVAARYRTSSTPAQAHWREQAPCEVVDRGMPLLIEGERPFQLRVGIDGWQKPVDLDSEPLGFGLHGVRIDAKQLGALHALDFTRHFADGRGWEGHDWRIWLKPILKHRQATA